jgi:hypothetical protein
MRRFLAAAACLFTVSCSFVVPDADITVLLPDLPAHWQAAFGDLGFRVVTIDSAGAARSVSVPAGQRTVVVLASREAGMPILAFPVTRYNRDAHGLLRPAGALASSGGTASLRWEDGPVASVMLSVAGAGRDISLFNAGRLGGYLAEKDDPWTVNLERVAERVASGDFSAYDIDERESRDISVTVGTGTWFLESPFAGAVEADGGGAVALDAITLGAHSLFSSDGRLVRLHVTRQEVTMEDVP